MTGVCAGDPVLGLGNSRWGGWKVLRMGGWMDRWRLFARNGGSKEVGKYIRGLPKDF